MPNNDIGNVINEGPEFQNSPLAALNTPSGGATIYQYPIDLLGNPSLSHYVQFFINVFTTNNVPDSLKGTPLSKFVTKGTSTPTNLNSTTSTMAQNIANNTANGANNGQIPINTKQSKVSIALYMPPEIVGFTDTPWERAELKLLGDLATDSKTAGPGKIDKLKAFGKDVFQWIGNDFGTGSSAILDLNISDTAGLLFRAAYNPHAEVLFRGINFRSFDFRWQFFPRTEQEAQMVWNIIQTFKYYSTPDINQAQAGRYFIYPATFDIQFMSNGQPNNFINKISTCALMRVVVNYTGNGLFSALKPGPLGLNGVPAEVHMYLSFIELELLNRQNILKGY